MIDRTRQEILTELERLSELTPDVRFGQLIANLSYLAVAPTAEAIWDMEDAQLLDAIREHATALSQRQVSVTLSKP
jgi:DNA-binding transcriptional ArsR family regulator